MSAPDKQMIERVANDIIAAVLSHVEIKNRNADDVPTLRTNVTMAQSSVIEILSAITPPNGDEVNLREAAHAVIERMSSTYKSRNGREMGIQGDDGEKCWIVHSDEIEELRAALAKEKWG